MSRLSVPYPISSIPGVSIFRGVSETVIPGNELKATLREEGIASRAVATIQSAEQIKEMERLAAKDVRRAEMLEKGLSKEQIAAYLGKKKKAPTSFGGGWNVD